MVSNPIRSCNALPLDSDAWIKAYLPLSNWPVQKWLQFQRPENGNLQDGLMALYDFQQHFNINEPIIQREMLSWLMKSATWNRTSLGSWDEWNTILKATPHWSLPVQSQILTDTATRLLPVSPAHYGAIANVEDHFGRYWNQVHSRIPAVTDIIRGSINNTNTPWETYNTFRRELSNGVLLDHSNNTRWMDFNRLSKTPASWREVLTPLYQSWLTKLTSTAHIDCADLQSWLQAFDDNNLDASKFSMPSFEDPSDYSIWSIPFSWSASEPENAFGQLMYLEKSAQVYMSEMDDSRYPSTILQWSNDCCEKNKNAWSLEKRRAASEIFFLSLGQHNYNRFSRNTSKTGTLHELLLRWLPEHTAEFEGLKSSMDVLGLDYLETTTDYSGFSKKQYTANSAKQEMEHYTTMLSHLWAPELASPTEDVGHLFDAEDSALLGI